MIKDIRTAWVKALRSGDYEQGTKYLRMDGKFCCLGVLCDLAERAGIPLAVVASISNYPVVYDTHTMTLPYQVVKWSGIGLGNEFGKYFDPKDEVQFSHSLARDNDDGKSFAEIADIIEREF